MRMPANAHAFSLRFFSPKSAAPRRKENATLEKFRDKLRRDRMKQRGEETPEPVKDKKQGEIEPDI